MCLGVSSLAYTCRNSFPSQGSLTKANISSLGIIMEARVAELATGTDYVRIVGLRPNRQPAIVESQFEKS